uniref:Uncharacterized protein n=1 Tax=Anguilla anguilla TaxID=7936 RepID=A0A0E9QAI6_ANGAN
MLNIVISATPGGNWYFLEKIAKY